MNASGWASGIQAFYQCLQLVGSNGTTYASSRVSYQHMRVDGGTAAPGYLAVK